jgi:hypothetical protein
MGSACSTNGESTIYRILVGKLEWKGSLGTLWHSWEYNIKMDQGAIGWGCMDWFYLAQERFPESFISANATEMLVKGTQLSSIKNSLTSQVLLRPYPRSLDYTCRQWLLYIFIRFCSPARPGETFTSKHCACRPQVVRPAISAELLPLCPEARLNWRAFHFLNLFLYLREFWENQQFSV